VIFFPALDMASKVILAPGIFILGLCLGSFATMLSWRVPRGRSIIAPPSACPSCGTRLTGADLVPVLSWAAQGGRCRHCKTKVPARYPLIELSTGGLCLALFFALGPTPALWPALAGAATGVAAMAARLETGGGVRGLALWTLAFTLLAAGLLAAQAAGVSLL